MRYSSRETYQRLVRWWLTGIVIYMPFQYQIVKIISDWNKELASIGSRIDEVTTVIFILPAVIKLYRDNKIFDTLYVVLFAGILGICLSCILSGIINDNSLLITLHGTFAYIKNFFAIFIYAAFFTNSDDLKRLLRLLIIIAVFIGVTALIEESWMLYSKYILAKDLPVRGWRTGLYRTSSLMVHYNILGLYSLLILTLYLHMTKKVNFLVYIPLLAGIFFSISRTVLTAFAFLAGMQFIRRRDMRWVNAALFVSISAFLVILGLFQDSSILSSIDIMGLQKNSNVMTYREYARKKAFEVWQDHPLAGVGPGMFGGSIATKYNSPIYDEYHFTHIMRWFKSLDQFWPQILAETGVSGTAMFTGLLMTLIIVLAATRSRSDNEEIRSLLSGLIFFMIAIFIYTFGSNLNIAAILFTYNAIVGSCIGIVHKYRSQL